jgi:transketolase
MRYGFRNPALSPEALAELGRIAREARGDILRMTTLAKSGHPGGSLSSIDYFLAVLATANIFPDGPRRPDRDRVLVSHGHTSPAVYAALAGLGFFPREEVVSLFRRTGSLFEGHVERTIPGIEWSSGNLGQGLSAAVGFAIASRHLPKPFHVFALMSDAEQAKGQVGEARRIAMKFGLGNITCVIDWNRLQLSGSIEEIMPQHIRAGYEADGWRVLECDGHDFAALYGALREAVSGGKPTAIMARTVMGKGVPFIENDFEYHGKALKDDEFTRAMEALGLDPDLAPYKARRAAFAPTRGDHAPPPLVVDIDPGQPRTYAPTDKADNRGAFGKALRDIADLNAARPGATPIIAFDCDLMGSVKTDSFAAGHPGSFYQCGVQEHATATAAGAASSQGIQAFFADFGVFAIDEVYNQQRLNDINAANLKVVGTHLGLNVGEDGKTHQCIDYVGLTRNLPGFRTIIPGDPNQTDRAVRWMASEPGNFFLGMGRSVVPIVTDEKGAPFYGPGYTFVYGRADRIRDGKDAAILTYGSVLGRALAAREKLAAEGLSVAVWNFACPVHLDREALRQAAATGHIVTFEDHLCNSGLAAGVARLLLIDGLPVKFRCHGLGAYAPSGDFNEVYDAVGLSVDALVANVRSLVAGA